VLKVDSKEAFEAFPVMPQQWRKTCTMTSIMYRRKQSELNTYEDAFHSHALVASTLVQNPSFSTRVADRRRTVRMDPQRESKHGQNGCQAGNGQIEPDPVCKQA
jgi:hypothetical protein